MVPRDNQAPGTGSKGGIGGLGCLSDGGEEPQSEGVRGNGGKGLPTTKRVER